MVQVLILSGGGRYSDPWHKFADTSRCLAEIANACGYATEITFDVAEAMADLDGVDVLIANAARAQDEAPSEDALSRAATSLKRFVERGGGALGLHVGVSTLTDLDQWHAIMGGSWVRGVSMHPPLGPSRVWTRGDAHVLTSGLSTFELIDERYTHMQVEPDIDAALFHEIDGKQHPLVWTRDSGNARAVADCLGHGVESFESVEHRQVLTRALRWLARDH